METVTVLCVGAGVGVGAGAGVGVVGELLGLLLEPPQLQMAKVAAAMHLSASDDRMPIEGARAIPLKNHVILLIGAVVVYRRRNRLRTTVLTVFWRRLRDLTSRIDRELSERAVCIHETSLAPSATWWRAAEVR